MRRLLWGPAMLSVALLGTGMVMAAETPVTKPTPSATASHAAVKKHRARKTTKKTTPATPTTPTTP